MKTPLYPPAEAFEPPVRHDYRLSLAGAPVGELMADKDAWAIVLKHMPLLKYVVSSPGAQSQLPNMTVIDFGNFSMSPDPVVVAKIDAELARLPARGAGR